MKYSLYGMRQEQVADLLNTFPALYRHFILHGLAETGHDNLFDCGHGRFQLVFELSRAIEIASRDQGLDPRSRHWPMAVRVADVDGKLEFNLVTQGVDDLSVFPLYLVGAARPLLAPRFRKLIADAERKSFAICDSCGQAGNFRDSHTSCNWCAGERARIQGLEDEILADELRGE